MRVGVLALQHESNTFVASPTTLTDFANDLLAEKEAVRQRFAGTHHEVWGFFEQLDDERIEAVPLYAARALPHGPLTAATAALLVERLMQAVDEAGLLDGLLVAPHGAAVARSEPDFDGLWLTTLRQRVGKVPIVATLDLHANLSPRMVMACDGLIAYRTNPHLDQRERGREAARLLARTLRGEVRPVMAAAFPPLVVNIECQATAETPCRELYAQAEKLRQRPGILAVSLLLGFPYADVPEMGAAVVVVADSNVSLARAAADELAGWWWDRRHEFQGRLIDTAEAVDLAARLDGPVCLLDMGDNVGGGSPGDGTVLAQELLRRGVGPACICLCDPEAARQAAVAGVGTRLPLQVGGKTDSRHGPPLAAVFTVRGLFDGKFTETAARHGGKTQFDQGPTAVVTTDTGLTLVLTSRRMMPVSLSQLTSCGLDPATFQVLVAKGVHAPVAAYAPICRHLVRVSTPGVTSADLTRLTYHCRRRPLFPFEPETDWKGTPAALATTSRCC